LPEVDLPVVFLSVLQSAARFAARWILVQILEEIPLVPLFNTKVALAIVDTWDAAYPACYAS